MAQVESSRFCLMGAAIAHPQFDWDDEVRTYKLTYPFLPLILSPDDYQHCLREDWGDGDSNTI